MSQLTHLPPPKRQRKSLQSPNPEVRKRLMDASASLINEGGFAALRIEEIAERAGLSVGTFYLYFEGKADLFINLVQEYTQRLRERLETDGGLHSEERLDRALDAYLDFVEENEQSFLHFVRVSGSMQTNMGPLSNWALNTHAEDLQPGIERAISAGLMRRMDPVLASHAIVGLIQHLVVYWLEHREQCSRQELRRFLLGFISFGLARREDYARPPRR